MKKCLCIFLILFLLLPAASWADNYIFDLYTLFIDGHSYNAMFNAGFDFDTQVYDMYFYDDFSGGIFARYEWAGGVQVDNRMIEFTYANHPDGFTITLDSGTVFDGYWDDNDEDMWLCLGGTNYFRFHPVPTFSLSEDMIVR